MKIYWNLKAIPELNDQPASIRLKAWFACVNKTLLHWQVWVAFSGAILPGTAIYIALALTNYMLIGLVVFILLVFPSVMIFNQIQCEIIRPYIRKYLNKTQNK